MIRSATREDAEAIADIYNHYIENTVTTFEETALTRIDVAGRIAKVQLAGYPWFVAESMSGIVGYAYASPWKARAAYRHTAEVSVYILPSAASQGWGTKLYQALFGDLRDRAFHTVIGGVTLPNPASVALHQKFGMKKVAHFEHVGRKFEDWLDVGYWQLSLDTWAPANGPQALNP